MSEPTFREMVEAIKDCADKILAGNDPGYLWTTTLHAHCGVLAEDFTIFGTPRPDTLTEIEQIERAGEIPPLRRFVASPDDPTQAIPAASPDANREEK